MINILSRVLTRILPARIAGYLRIIKWRIRPPEREVEYAAKLLRAHKGTVIDIGANNGLYALLLSGQTQNVIAFEANPALAANLQAVAPKNVRVINCALSNQPGLIKLKIPRIGGAQNTGMATVSSKNTFETQLIDGVDEITVEAHTLDGYVRQHAITGIAFIKIDVEGFEKEVLEGALQTIQQEHPVLLIETELRHKADIAGIFRMLEERAYSAYYLNNKGDGLLSVVAEEIGKLQSPERMAAKTANHYDFSYVNNFFFIPRNLLPRIQSVKG